MCFLCQFWDLRAGESVCSIYGAHVCGDSIDCKGYELLAGSYKPTKQLQLYDVRTRELISTVPYRQALGDLPALGDMPSVVAKPATCKIYAASLSKPSEGGDDPNLIAAAGSGTVEGTGEVRVFARDGLAPLGRSTLPRGVYGLDTTRGCTRVAITGGGNKVRVLRVPERAPAVELA